MDETVGNTVNVLEISFSMVSTPWDDIGMKHDPDIIKRGKRAAIENALNKLRECLEEHIEEGTGNTLLYGWRFVNPDEIDTPEEQKHGNNGK